MSCYPSAATAAADIERVVPRPETRLTNDIIAVHAQNGCVTRDDLRRRGWRDAAIDRYIDAARARAGAHFAGEAFEDDEARPRTARAGRKPPASWPQPRRSTR